MKKSRLIILGTVAAVALAAGLVMWARGRVVGERDEVVVPLPALFTRPEPLVPAGYSGPFTITFANSYFGRNDSLLTLRSSDQSVELIDSPQDRFSARPEQTIGRFRTKVSGELWSRIGSAHGDASRGGDVLDRPTAVVVVELAGASRTLVPPPQLAALLTDATRAAWSHPVNAIRLDVRRGPDCVLFAIENVGTEPAAFANPLRRSASAISDLFTLVIPPATPGVTQGPPDRKPLAFEPAVGESPELVNLEPGQRFELRSVPWHSANPQEKVGGEWQDEGSSEQTGGVFRVRGFLKSSLR